MLGWIMDSQLRKSFALQWELAPLSVQLLAASSLVFPFAFYGVCIWACFAKRRSRWLSALVLIVGLVAIPFFTHLHATLPTVAKNSIWSAFFSFIPYFAEKHEAHRLLQAEMDNAS
jgi:hypothetical protein